MDKDLDALNQLIDDAVNEEKSLAIKADELALQNKQFAEWLAQKKHNDERLAQLWELVKEFMVENNLTEHENDYIKEDAQMRIYKNTIEHRGWEDDINELAIYTTWPMTKHEFVEYYNKNIAGTITRNCEDYGVTHSIYRFDGGVDRFPWLEYILDEDEDEDDHSLKFSDDGDRYEFMRCSFNVMDSGADGEKE